MPAHANKAAPPQSLDAESVASLLGVTRSELDGAQRRAGQLLLRGQANEAVELLTSLVLLNPTDSSAYRMLGLACQRANEHDGAILAFAAAIKLSPEDTISKLLRAESELCVAGPERAIEHLEAALCEQTTDPAAQPFVRRGKSLLQFLRAQLGKSPRSEP